MSEPSEDSKQVSLFCKKRSRRTANGPDGVAGDGSVVKNPIQTPRRITRNSAADASQVQNNAKTAGCVVSAVKRRQQPKYSHHCT